MKPHLEIDVLNGERSWLGKLALRMVRDRDEADDVVQEAYLAALESPPLADRPTRGWLGRVATNVVRARYRAGTRRERREKAALPPEPTSDSFDLVHKEQATAVLARALDELGEPYRSAVKLRFLAERSVAEIAAEQGVPLGTAGWRVSEGLKRLRTRLDRDAGGDARPWLMALCPGVGLSEETTAASPAPAYGGMTMSKIVVLFVLAMVCATVLVTYQRWSSASQPTAARPTEVAASKLASQPVKVQAASSSATDPGRGVAGRSSAVRSGNPGGESGASSGEAFQLTFAVVGEAGKEVPTDMLSDIPESGSVLRQCLDDFLARSPDSSRVTSATVRVTLVQDLELGVVVADSDYLDEASDGDAELQQCLEAGAFAVKIDQPIGAPGKRLVVDVGVSYDPSLLEAAKQASVAACLADLKQRKPGVALEGRITDPEFARCMDGAFSPVPVPSLSADIPAPISAALQACRRNVDSRSDGSTRDAAGEFAACAAAAGVTVLPAASPQVFIRED
jgi:RNA polymerase sigma-70 factor (ECF subfamily)